MLAGRFLERLERRGGVWKISERQLIRDAVRLDPVKETWRPEWSERPTAFDGKRGQADLSYQYLTAQPGSERK